MFFQKQPLRLFTIASKINNGVCKSLTRPTTIRNHHQRPMSTDTSRQRTETDDFLDIFPEIVSTAVESGCKTANTKSLGPWIKELLEYNSHGGYKVRGLMTVAAYEMLEDPAKISQESMRRARIVGWCMEIIQTALVLFDDILDNSSMRRGSVCWYRLPQVGLRAINDSEVLIGLAFDILRRNFGEETFYPALIDCFNEGKLLFSLGQHLDYSYSTFREYHHFTLENYNIIASTKMANCSIKFPAHCGLILANKAHNGVFNNMRDIIKDIGILIMMQNDFMDCFGNETVAGKLGTDIEEGKCTWLAVQALQKLDAAQRADFEACYGRDDGDCVQRVKQLYLDLELPALYHETKDNSYQSIVRRIQELPSDNVIPHQVLLKLLHMMYNLRSNLEY